MSPSAFARDLAKSRMICCCGTEEPSLSHTIERRAPVSILSSCAGPQVVFVSASLFSFWTVRDIAAHSFHTQRHRAHSASSRSAAPDDTRSR